MIVSWPVCSGVQEEHACVHWNTSSRIDSYSDWEMCLLQAHCHPILAFTKKIIVPMRGGNCEKLYDYHYCDQIRTT